MMRAYDELYLDGAMENLGEAFDYAAIACEVDLDLFFSLFVTTGFAERFGAGEPKVIAGLSGTELAIEVLFEGGVMSDFPPARVDYALSAEYWCGWALAYCQWKTARSFAEIRRHVSAREMLELYAPLHEADEDRFVEAIEERIHLPEGPVRLQAQRKLSGLTQRALADKSGVNLRTLQQYESGAKDINKAAAETVLALSRVLGCQMEDLLEYR
ncbi:MAG: helix-turn-helix transcriptional regulator [Eggerthellaceae bacterium]|nr:helix-turn-helix transcriptional regulator [Eggerthellaceae bacterium]